MGIMDTTTAEITPDEKMFISQMAQNYMCTGLAEIAEDDERARSFFIKLGMIEPEESEK